MLWQEFLRVVQNAEDKTSLLWSDQQNLEALALQFEAYQAAWSAKQLLQTAAIIDSLCLLGDFSALLAEQQEFQHGLLQKLSLFAEPLVPQDASMDNYEVTDGDSTEASVAMELSQPSEPPVQPEAVPHPPPLPVVAPFTSVLTVQEQHIFASTDASTGRGKNLRENGTATHRPYLYQRALTFDTSVLRQQLHSAPSTSTTTAAAPSSPPTYYECMHSCDLIMATQCFNIGLFFHMRSKELINARLRESCQTMALDFYNTAVEIVSEPTIVSMAITNPNSCSLLVVIFNNKAVLCHENGDYDGCLYARQLLVLCLNTVATGENSTKESFLQRQDVLDLYGNGLLLLPPTTASVA